MSDYVYPYDHGFIAATCWNEAGKVSDPCARLHHAVAADRDHLIFQRLAQHFQYPHAELGQFVQK